MKFSRWPFFFPKVLGFFVGSDKETPEPEKATYEGGGGGVNSYSVLSDKLTESPPSGYFCRKAFGIKPLLSSCMNFLFSGSL